MYHNAAFHVGLHCLPKYSFRGFPNTKGLHAREPLSIRDGRKLDKAKLPCLLDQAGICLYEADNLAIF